MRLFSLLTKSSPGTGRYCPRIHGLFANTRICLGDSGRVISIVGDTNPPAPEASPSVYLAGSNHTHGASEVMKPGAAEVSSTASGVSNNSGACAMTVADSISCIGRSTNLRTSSIVIASLPSSPGGLGDAAAICARCSSDAVSQARSNFSPSSRALPHCLLV